MRRVERIDNFLKLVNWDQLQQRWHVEFDFHKDILNEIVEYWKQYPDQRFGQVLINLQLIQDSMRIWSDEEEDILIDQGVPPESCLFWTSMLDKEGNMLDEPITRLVSDLDTSHINRILEDYHTRLSPRYKQAFNNVINSRDDLEQDELITKVEFEEQCK